MFWEMNTNNQLRRWPKGDTAVNLQGNHLKTCFMPRKNFNTGNGIKLARKLDVDVLDKYGIKSIGFAIHHKGYFHSRVNDNFFDILYVSSGTLNMTSDNLRVTIKKGEVLILPPSLFCTTRVECKKTSLLYIHLPNDIFWRSRLGNDIKVKKLKYQTQTMTLLQMYEAEIFSKKYSLDLLDSLAKTISIYLKKEFFAQEKPADVSVLDNLICSEENIGKFDIQSVLREMKMSRTELNVFCKKELGVSFAKYVFYKKMNIAVEMLKRGLSVFEVSQKIKYADTFTFSKAFKRHFGKSPKKHMKQNK